MLKDSIEKSILKHNARVKKGFKPLTLEEAIMVMYFQDKLIEHNGIYVDTLVKDRNLPLGYEQLIKNKLHINDKQYDMIKHNTIDKGYLYFSREQPKLIRILWYSVKTEGQHRQWIRIPAKKAVR